MDSLLAEGNTGAVLGAMGTIAAAILPPSTDSSSSEQGSESATSETSEEQKQKAAEVQLLSCHLKDIMIKIHFSFQLKYINNLKSCPVIW